MIARAYFGTKVLPEDLVSGLDEPFLVEEELVLGVHHAIVATINPT